MINWLFISQLICSESLLGADICRARALVRQNLSLAVTVGLIKVKWCTHNCSNDACQCLMCLIFQILIGHSNGKWRRLQNGRKHLYVELIKDLKRLHLSCVISV